MIEQSLSYLKVSIQPISPIDISIENNSIDISIENIPIIECSSNKMIVEDIWPVYGGEYQVGPNATEDQILITANTRLTDNIVINKIPYYEVSNNAGGTTVSINS